MKNVFIAIAITVSFSACNTIHTNIAINPESTEARFCNFGCPFHGIGNGSVGSTGASASNGNNGASHGVGAAMGGMGHSGRGTSGNGASSGAAARK